MLSQIEQASLNLEQARALRTAGRSYREIRHALDLSVGQLGHIRRALKREKAGGTRLRARMPDATDRDLLVSRSILSSGLRRALAAAGYRTLGDLADRLSDPGLPGFEAMRGIGPHRAQLIRRLLDHYGLIAGRSDLQAAIETLFPEFGERD